MIENIATIVILVGLGVVITIFTVIAIIVVSYSE
jgi:hypothetical protein